MGNELHKTVGVIGGMGPEATVDFMSRVLDLTPASSDQDHVRMLVYNNPQVPDRQIDSQQQRLAVAEALSEMALTLQRAGADFLVMPCNTAHGFLDRALRAVDIPFVDLIAETVKAAGQALPANAQVGLLATDACLASGLYQSALADAGLGMLLPAATGQAAIMQLVFRIKAGDRGAAVAAAMHAEADALIGRGADVIIGGCTEIPLVVSAQELAVPYFASTAVLAQSTVDYCTGITPLPPG